MALGSKARGGTAALLATLSMLGWPSVAAADKFYGTRTLTLAERRHTGVLTLAPDRAELVVQRAVYNPAKVSDQATFMIDLPEGAVATRLRTRGIGPGAPWFEGELLEAEAAAARYRELTGLGGYYPKDPALLSWRYQGRLALQVFPCPAHSEKLVEYSLQLPLRYEQGRYHVKLRALGTEALPARIQVLLKSNQDELSVDGKPFSSGGYLPMPVGDDEELDVALRHQAAPLEVTLSSQDFASGRVLTHFAVRAAPRLSQPPKQPYVVIVVDGSRSLRGGFDEAAKAALGAYLSQMPDARVELLTFDRHVQRQLNGFADVSTALHAISVLALGKENGSEVDRALFDADQLLTTTPSGSARRIVLLTDGLTRSALTPERLRGAIGQSGAVLHVGLLHGGPTELSRDDAHPWASAVRTTGGLVWNASAPDESTLDNEAEAELRSVYEEWVRPLRIDHVSTFSDDGTLSARVAETLAEGEGSQELYLDSEPARRLSVSGELWSTPIKVLARRDATQDAHWAALLFGTELLNELSEPEQMTLAFKGHAVTPVTSFLAIEPGVRPSTDGLEETAFGIGGIGLGGIGVGGGGRDYGIGHGPRLDREGFLRDRLRRELTRCGGNAGSAYAEVETTLDEIVRVQVGATRDSLLSAVADCLTEGAWALLLPSGFDEDNAQFRVEL